MTDFRTGETNFNLKEEQWNSVRLRHLGFLKSGAGFPDEEQGVQGEDLPFFKVKHLAEADRNGGLYSSEHTISRETATRLGAFVFPSGTIVFAKIGAALLLNRVRFLGQESCIDNNMIGLVLNGRADRRFLLYSLGIVDFAKLANPGAVPSLDTEAVAEQLVLLPGRSHQVRIADHLDREMVRLNALIAVKERMLGLLSERRRALITRAVTRGLTPQAPRRDSGIPWLGQIPAHWGIKRLKHIGQAIIGLTFDPADIVSDGRGVLVLRAANVRDNGVTLNDNLFVLMDIPSNLRTRKDDILICSRSGSRDLIGKNALIDEASSGLTFGAFMTVFRSAHNPYLFHIFNSPLFDYQAGAFSTSTINQLTVETLNNMEVPIPPQDEQAAIVAFLKEELVQLDRLREATERSITLLKERRTALITAAVTGRIDV